MVRAMVEQAAKASDSGDAALTLAKGKEALRLSLLEGPVGEVLRSLLSTKY